MLVFSSASQVALSNPNAHHLALLSLSLMLVLQKDYHSMLVCPANVMLEYGGAGSKKRKRPEPISHFNLFDATVVEFSRSDRVRNIKVPVQPIQPRRQELDSIVEFHESDTKLED